MNDLHSIHTLAELGIRLLLFSLGLEFDLRKLRWMGAVAVLAGDPGNPLYTVAGIPRWSALGLGADGQPVLKRTALDQLDDNHRAGKTEGCIWQKGILFVKEGESPGKKTLDTA